MLNYPRDYILWSVIFSVISGQTLVQKSTAHHLTAGIALANHRSIFVLAIMSSISEPEKPGWTLKVRLPGTQGSLDNASSQQPLVCFNRRDYSYLPKRGMQEERKTSVNFHK